jgi:threonine dehydrogenase-like Zn-dependent dehydrogenase
MRVLFYPEYNALEIADRPAPEPCEDEVLLKVAACGICGSELETFRNRSPRRTPPLIMGHEFCGTIEQAGSGVKGFEAGQQVVSNALVPCNQCIRCERGDTHLCADRQIFGMHRGGAFGEFVNVPAACLTAWPEGVAAASACLAEPMANGLHIVHLTDHLSLRKVLIIGAGPIGLMTLQAFKAKKSVEIIVADISDGRLEIAGTLGADRMINSRETDLLEAIREMTRGEGVDLVVDAAGNSTTNKLAVDALRPGGAAVFIGLLENNNSVFSYDMILAEKTIIGTYAAKMEELGEALELMRMQKVDLSSWVHTFSLDEGVEGFRLMLEGSGEHVKGVLCPQV